MKVYPNNVLSLGIAGVREFCESRLSRNCGFGVQQPLTRQRPSPRGNYHAKKNTRVRQRTDIAATAEDYQSHLSRCPGQGFAKEMHMNQIVYIVGFVVIVIFVLGFLGFR